MLRTGDSGEPLRKPRAGIDDAAAQPSGQESKRRMIRHMGTRQVGSESGPLAEQGAEVGPLVDRLEVARAVHAELVSGERDPRVPLPVSREANQGELQCQRAGAQSQGRPPPTAFPFRGGVEEQSEQREQRESDRDADRPPRMGVVGPKPATMVARCAPQEGRAIEPAGQAERERASEQ